MPASGDLSPATPAPVGVDLPITLGQFVKLAGLAATGGEAKQLVTAGLVTVNGSTETRRGRKLADGDQVEAGGVVAEVAARGSGASTDRRARTARPPGDGRPQTRER